MSKRKKGRPRKIREKTAEPRLKPKVEVTPEIPICPGCHKPMQLIHEGPSWRTYRCEDCRMGQLAR